MRGTTMRAAAIWLCALAACATAPAPAPGGNTAPTAAGPPPRPRPAAPPPAPPPPAELAERIVTAQGRTDGKVLANVFFAVQDDLEPGDDQRVENALRVIEEIAARMARLRAPKQPADELAYAGDNLDPLVDRIDELVERVIAKGSCAVEPAAARAAAEIDRVPRTRRAAQASPSREPSGRPMSKRALVCAMNTIKPLIADCYARHQVPGTAMVNVVIDKQGAVTTASTSGKFAGTPTGACVDAAVKTAIFPPSDGISTPYPFQLK